MERLHLLPTNKKHGWSGEVAMIAELARGLATRDYRVTLATNMQATIVERLSGSGVEFLYLTLLKEMPRIVWTLLDDMGRLAKYVREQKVRLIHTHASFDTWTAALSIRSYHLEVPLIRTKHNLKRIRTNWLNQWFYGKAIDHLIAPPRALVEDLQCSHVVPNRKINYVPNGIAIDRMDGYQNGKAKARKLLNIPEHAEVIAYISRLTRPKDPATLVKAVLKALQRRPHLRLLVVGDGDDCLRAELEEIADGSPAVEFWGHRDDAPCILAAADVFVQPSLTETFGLAPLEAMLQGVATIVSDAEGFRDFVEDGVNGLVFPRGDSSALAHAIERVLADPDFRDRIAAGGKRTVRERFSSERMVDDIERLYQNVLNR